MFKRGPKYCCLELALLLVAANVAEAASFDCSKASTDIEHVICRDPALSQLDGELGAAYRARLGLDPGLRESQVAWIRERNQRCGPDVACLTGILRERISVLEGSTATSKQTATNPRPTPPAEPALIQPAPVVEIQQIEPLDLDRIERIQPPPPNDPIEELVSSYFDSRGGNLRCGQGWRSYRDNSDLAAIYGLSAAELPQPKFRSYQPSQAELAAFHTWQSCHMYATEQRWARLIPAISYIACNRAAAGVSQNGDIDESQNGLADVLDDLKSSCGSHAEQAESGARFVASVRRLADRINLVAAEAANRTLAQYGEQRRQLAESAAMEAQRAEQQRAQQEIAKAEREAYAAKRAEEVRQLRAEYEAMQADESRRVAAAKKKECDAVLKDDATINRIALQILDRTYDGGTCAKSMFVCQQLITAYATTCSFGPKSEVARCLVRQMHECGEGG